jgi:hypothetical protein
MIVNTVKAFYYLDRVLIIMLLPAIQVKQNKLGMPDPYKKNFQKYKQT